MGRVDMLCLLCRRTYTNTWSQADQVAQDFCELHIVALFLRHVFLLPVPGFTSRDTPFAS